MPLGIALAGRRVDAADASEPRFPLASVPLVRDRLHAFFTERPAAALVSSAACGADLVALEVAGGLGLRRRVVLPFAPERFRETSVVDRPGDWGALYDRIIAAIHDAGDLMVLEHTSDAGAAYEVANARILDEALALAGTSPVGAPVASEMAVALVVWEGQSRGADDTTQQFADAARRQGFKVEEILTR